MEHIRRDIELGPGDHGTALFTIMPNAANQYAVSIGNETGHFDALEVPIPEITIDEMFIGTHRYGYTNAADYGAYIRLRNHGSVQVSVGLRIIDWQDWCGERRGIRRSLDIPPNDIARRYEFDKLFDDQWAYVRYEVDIDGTIILDSPRFYFIPGKIYMGGENIAVGECIRSVPGEAVLWYSQRSDTDRWQGNYYTPPQMQGPPIQGGQFDYRVRDYHSKSWAGAFFPIFDPELITGARYESYITNIGQPYRDTVFQWTQ